MVVIYTKNGCMPCHATKRMFKQEQIEYIEINIENNETLRNQLTSEGWHSMPVIKTRETSWSGFQPDRIKNLK